MNTHTNPNTHAHANTNRTLSDTTELTAYQPTSRRTSRSRKLMAQQKLDAELAGLIDQTLTCLTKELKRRDLYPNIQPFVSPELVKNYLTLALALEDREHFHVLFLNNQHKLISDERMFSGTLDGAAVYPREVVKLALHYNANALIFAHNHPSGICEPSHGDKAITEKLKAALATFDIRVLDHLIVGHENVYSFAEAGLL